MASITVSGVGSGVDVNDLVSQLVAAERKPVEDRLDAKEADFQAKLSQFGLLKSALSDLEGSLAALKQTSTFRSVTATSADTDVFTATASASAASGAFDVRVEKLAESQKLFSAGYASANTAVGTGTLTISVNGAAFGVSIGSGENTLAGIRNAINGAQDNTGVTAAIVNVDDGAGGTESKLVLSANTSGTDGAFSISVDDDDGTDTDASGLSNLVHGTGAATQAAVDAEIYVDGQKITRSSNTIADAIEGISFSLVAAKPGETIDLTVGTNSDGVAGAVDRFVEAFNSVANLINGSARYDPATATAGVLFGDSTVRSLEASLRNALGAQITGISGGFRSLAEVGITTGRDGKLTVDSDALSTALSQDPDAVTDVFTSSNGVALRLEGQLSGYLDANGTLDSRIDGLNGRIDGISGQRTELDRRMESLEQRLSKQFTAMDLLVSRLRTTSDFLTNQLASLQTLVTGRKSN